MPGNHLARNLREDGSGSASLIRAASLSTQNAQNTILPQVPAAGQSSGTQPAGGWIGHRFTLILNVYQCDSILPRLHHPRRPQHRRLIPRLADQLKPKRQTIGARPSRHTDRRPAQDVERRSECQRAK